ncbi:MAG: hypothetical protein FJ253_06320 [Phycisphaerae bacterium]|nr:hypothetical protein [Phycisphaerae bacterium]
MNDLTCREFVEFLDDYRTGAIAPERRATFERHLSNCRHCRDYLRTYEDSIRMGRAAIGAEDQPIPDELPKALSSAILNAIRFPATNPESPTPRPRPDAGRCS